MHLSLPRLASALLVLIALSACTTSRFEGGAYKSRDGSLTCNLPAGRGWNVKREGGPGSMSVTWLNDFNGEMYKVEKLDATMLPPAFLSQPRQTQTMESLEKVVLPHIRTVASDTRLISQSYWSDLQGGAAYGVFDVPGGSPIMSSNLQAKTSGQRARVLRSVMIFRTDRNFIIATHVPEHLGAIINHGSSENPGTTDKALPDFLDFVRSIRVTD